MNAFRAGINLAPVRGNGRVSQFPDVFNEEGQPLAFVDTLSCPASLILAQSTLDSGWHSSNE